MDLLSPDDLVLATDSGDLFLHHNTGTGAAWPRTLLGSGSFEVDYAFAAGDLDGDGGEDLFVQDGADVGWFRSGAGTLGGYQVIYPNVKLGPALVDVNGDGILDVVSEASGPTVRWLINDGLGNFTPDSHTHGLACGTVADLDGDGIADIVAMRQQNVLGPFGPSDYYAEWQRGIGGGAFAPLAPLSTFFNGTCFAQVSAATGSTFWSQPDRNGDGVPELLLRGSCGGFAVENLRGLSVGPTTWVVDPTLLAPVRRHGDVDGDRLDDLFMNDPAVTWARQGVGAALGPLTSLLPRLGGSRADVGDLDRDRRLDVVTQHVANPGVLSVFRGQGGGAFASAQTQSTHLGQEPRLADIDRDGDLDAITYVDSRRFAWAEGDGAGGFGPTHLVGDPGGVFEYGGVEVGDFDNDGHLDVVLSSESNPDLRLFRGSGASGAAAFHPVAHRSSGAKSLLSVGDLEGDGDVDVVTYLSNQVSVPVTIHLNQGNGNFAPGAVVTILWARRLALADADRDGDLDIFTCGDGVYCFAEQSAPGSFASPVTRMLTQNRRYDDLDLGDLDGDGFVDLVFTSRVRIDESDPCVDLVFGGPLGFGAPIHQPTALPANHLALRDVDGDADLDVLLASDMAVAWLENPLGGLPSVGATYCSNAVPNSTGGPGRIEALGSASLGRRNLRLVARDLTQGSAGYFLAATARGFVPSVSLSQGSLCLGGAIGRFVGPGQIGNAGAAGRIELQVNLSALPTPTGPALALAGSTWNFQAWYRDSNPGPTSNFTDATSVTFEP